MNIRKRTFLAMAAALVASTALAGPALAQDKPVVVYTAHNSSIVDKLLPIFEKDTGLKAEVVKMGSGDVARRAKAEAANPAADVIWSISGSALTELADILEPYKPADYDKINTSLIQNDAWTPYTGVVYVLAVNTSILPLDQAPKSWAELADPKWKGQITSARADNSGSALQQLQGVLTIFGDKGWDEYDKIAKNFVLSDSSGAVPRYVADGETSMGLTLEDNALLYVKGGSPMSIVHLTDGTIATPDGVALVKGGPNPDGGKKFIDWALSKSTQETLVKEIGRRSARTDVGGPEGMPDLTSLKLVKLKSLAELGGTEAILEKWRAATGQ
ncbi:extracellular solute-binding protein [Mesorhizobium sp. CN5-321]|uniref:extracellular solute-binding protein n=1 Tax=Mesorhizobium hunchu TaxID=3157708 RepID=UPI0032B74832